MDRLKGKSICSFDTIAKLPSVRIVSLYTICMRLPVSSLLAESVKLLDFCLSNRRKWVSQCGFNNIYYE